MSRARNSARPQRRGSHAGLKYLAGLKKLRSLCLDRTQVTDPAIKELRKALPNCRIEIARDLLGVALGHCVLLRARFGRPVTARDLRHDLAFDQGANVPLAVAEAATDRRIENLI